MTPFELTAILMTIVALAGWANAKTLRLPHGVAMLIAGLVGAMALFAARAFGFSAIDQVVAMVSRIDFSTTVTGYMLAFLLFAGAMQVDLVEVRRYWAAIGILATLGVAGSIVIVGFGMWFVAGLLGIALPLSWALVFGALISPTDPVAVLATVKHGRLSNRLKVVLQGEALFNDGVGIVAFTALLAFATVIGDASPIGAILSAAVQSLRGLALRLITSGLVIV